MVFVIAAQTTDRFKKTSQFKVKKKHFEKFTNKNVTLYIIVCPFPERTFPIVQYEDVLLLPFPNQSHF